MTLAYADFNIYLILSLYELCRKCRNFHHGAVCISNELCCVWVDSCQGTCISKTSNRTYYTLRLPEFLGTLYHSSGPVGPNK